MVWNRLGPLQQIQNLTVHDYLASSKLNAMSARPSATSLSPAVDTQEALPVFDLAPFIALDGQTPAAQLMQQCQQLADCLARTGCLLIRDPRVAAADNDQFLDLLESYFSRSDTDKMAEARPHLAYQVGCTPAGIETPRCLVEPEVCQELIRQFPADAQPLLPTGPDVKWRYFWRVGPRPQQTQYAELNAEPVVPQGLPQWSSIMDSWGSKLLEAVHTVSTMAALGFGLEADAFTKLMHQGPHLLAPTGSDLNKHGQKGTVLAGFHYDLNFITIHGKSRFPGLHVWLADGRRLPVAVPPGCLLCQAGKQLEWLTGGHVKAGMHEVIVTDATESAIAAAKAAGRCCWRVSSTVFSHIASDQVLQPLGQFAQAAAARERYPPTAAGLQVQRELEAIRLMRH